jgi:hypothetical protein
MEKPELIVFWMENCLLVMDHPGLGVIVTPPECVTLPHRQFWNV